MSEPSPPRPPADAKALVDAEGRRWWACDLCGHRMLDLHCKLRCQACGFVRDCSDP
jgi:rubrerythrin